MVLKIGKMEGAPPWYGTPFDKLDFEWTKEEKLELERYCEKINKNITEEDMTPRQRFVATMQGKPKDRLHFEIKYNMPFGTRVLDNHSDAVKPGDIYKWPKLHVKAHLCTAARHKIDIMNMYVITYGENFWGADARMMDYGTPMILGEPPIKSMKDIEGIEVPDPFKHSLYPGYLWAAKEIIRITKEYKTDLPFELSYCGGPMGTVTMSNIMMSMPNWMKAVRKEPELAKATFDLSSQWSIKFGRACKSLHPDGCYLCDTTGSTPVATTEWIMPFYTMIGEGVRQGDKNFYQWHTTGSPGWMPWMPLYVKYKAVGPSSYNGWWIGPDMPFRDVYKFSAEHNLYCGCSVLDTKMLEGDPTIEDDIKQRCECAKEFKSQHAMQALGVLDYWTPPENFDRCIAWVKKYGKY